MTAPILGTHQPVADPPQPYLHHRSVCTCPDPELLLTTEQVDAIHDYISPEAIEAFTATIGAEVVDLEFDDPRPILCRGYKCRCRSFARWRSVAGYTECECGHSQQAHRLPGKKKAAKQ